MVSMSIFAVITGFVLVNYRAGSWSDELRLSADGAASVMRNVLFRATGGSLVDVCITSGGVKRVLAAGASCAAGETALTESPSAWGFAFGTGDPEKILVFADLDSSGFPSPNEVVESSSFSQSGLVVTDSAQPSSVLTSVVMAVPSLDQKVNGAPPVGEAELVLKHEASGAIRAVRYVPLTRRVDVGNP